MRTMSRRRFVRLSALSWAGTLLAACGRVPAPPEGEPRGAAAGTRPAIPPPTPSAGASAPAARDAAPLPPAADETACRVFLSEERLATLRERIASGAQPTAAAWSVLRAEADRNLTREPHVPEHWYVPGYYVDPDGHRTRKGGLMEDANAAYSMALAFRMTDDERYAAAALRLINAWPAGLQSTDRRDDSTLCFSYHFPALILAADLLRACPAWTAPERQAWDRFLRETALPIHCMARANNWGNWGLVLVAAIGAWFGDREILASAAARWKEFVADQIAADGHLRYEVGRNNGTGDHGLWYSHFSLLPQTIAAEILRLNGHDLYDYVAPNGRTLRMAFHRLAPWARFPETFPYYRGAPPAPTGSYYASYFEILQPRWPHPDAALLLAERRPLTATHATPHLTFTHGEPLVAD